MKLGQLCCAAAIMATLVLGSGCSSPASSHASGGPFYSLEAEANSAHPSPIKPVHEVGKTEAEKHDAYGVAYYDQQGRIISYSKHLSGHEDSFCRYFYDDKSVFEHEECRDSSGTISKRYFGADGSVLRTQD